MSFVDTVGPFVFFVLLGLAAVIAAASYAALVVSPRLHKVSQLVQFNAGARQLVDDVIYESRTTALISQRLVDQAFALKEIK